MADSELRSIIDNLDHKALKDFIEKTLNKNAKLRAEFINKFKNQSDIDILKNLMSELDNALFSLDSAEYLRCSYEYWDDTDPLGDLIRRSKNIIQKAEETLIKQENITSLNDFLHQAVARVKKFDINELIADCEYDPNCDTGEDEYRVIEELLDFIEESIRNHTAIPDSVKIFMIPEISKLCSLD